MNDIKEIIKNSTYKIEDGNFVYAKISKPPSGDHFLVAKDSDEITVVTKEEKLSGLQIIEKNKERYKLIALNVSVPFYSVGFIATVTSAIARGGMNVLVVSTYSKDYILVKQENIEKTEQVLRKLGFKKA